jgi:hypothetical protein
MNRTGLNMEHLFERDGVYNADGAFGERASLATLGGLTGSWKSAGYRERESRLISRTIAIEPTMKSA